MIDTKILNKVILTRNTTLNQSDVSSILKRQLLVVKQDAIGGHKLFLGANLVGDVPVNELPNTETLIETIITDTNVICYSELSPEFNNGGGNGGDYDLTNYFNKQESDARYLFQTALNGYATETWVNNRGFLSSQSLSVYYNKTQSDARYSQLGHTHSYDQITDKPTLAIVATSGSYNDLNDKPSIPSIDGLATETYVDNKVSGLVGQAPETLNTLNELASALGDDPNFATTVSNQIGLKANTADVYNKTQSDSRYVTLSGANQTISSTKTFVGGFNIAGSFNFLDYGSGVNVGTVIVNKQAVNTNSNLSLLTIGNLNFTHNNSLSIFKDSELTNKFFGDGRLSGAAATNTNEFTTLAQLNNLHVGDGSILNNSISGTATNATQWNGQVYNGTLNVDPGFVLGYDLSDGLWHPTNQSQLNAGKWNGNSYVGTDVPVNIYMMAYGSDGAWHPVGVDKVKTFIELNDGSFLNNVASDSIQWNGQENDYSTYGTSLDYLVGKDILTNKTMPFTASQIKSWLNTSLQDVTSVDFKTSNVIQITDAAGSSLSKGLTLYYSPANNAGYIGTYDYPNSLPLNTVINPNGGNVGFGVTPTSKVTIQASTVGSDGGIRLIGSTYPTDISYWGENQIALQYQGVYHTVFRATGDSYLGMGGNVGIGTSSSTDKFQVSGAQSSFRGGNDNSLLINLSAFSDPAIIPSNEATTADKNLLLAPYGGNVAIGSGFTPSDKLEVSTSADQTGITITKTTIEGSAGGALSFRNVINNGTLQQIASISGQLVDGGVTTYSGGLFFRTKFLTTSTNAGYIAPNGYWGVGNITNPLAQLHVAGDAQVNGNILLGFSGDTNYITSREVGQDLIVRGSGSLGFDTYASGWTRRMTINNAGDAIFTNDVYMKNLVVGNGQTSSYITMVDNDNNDRILHTNTGRIGFLSSALTWGAWCDNSGNWATDNQMYAAGYSINGVSTYLNSAGLCIGAGNGNGIGFWDGGSGVSSSYSIWMGDTDTYGGNIRGMSGNDYNMYFRMSGLNRGFVFYTGNGTASVQISNNRLDVNGGIWANDIYVENDAYAFRGSSFTNAGLRFNATNGRFDIMSTSATEVVSFSALAGGGMKVYGGDIEIVNDATKGIILHSPDGTAYRITVANGGTLQVNAV